MRVPIAAIGKKGSQTVKDKKFQIVVFGATSFVGQILCRYLLDTFGLNSGLRWAVAGRSKEKLNQLCKDLGAAAENLPILIADAGDEGALKSLCEDTEVVVSTVGPYALFGEPLVKTCAQTGTDYCDLTGEAQWIRRMISRYESTAQGTGARIVHCCGFDSIPSDLGVYFVQQQARAQFSEPCVKIKMRVKADNAQFN